jgi:8-oxo-dGTP diphosphatase
MPSRSTIGRTHALALELYARLPAPMRLWAVRIIAPSHTVGALCMIEHDGHLLMLRQRHRRGWTLPGGLVNRGESAEHAVVREVREEVGLQIEVGLAFSTVVEPSVRRVDVLYHVPVSARPPVQVAGEAVHAEWVRPDEAGPIDLPTRQALAELARYRAGAAHDGRLADQT